MTPAAHIVTIINPDDGSLTFECNFCGASVGPVPKDVPIGQVELFHKDTCFYTETVRLTMHAALGRMDN